MLYDIRLAIEYEYEAAADSGRHVLRMMPRTIDGVQRVVAASLDCAPLPAERSDRVDFFGNAVTTRYSSRAILEEVCRDADLVIGAVLIPGASAPKLISRDFLSSMKPGSVLVDVAIDQGGCFETSRATTHDDPTYVVDGVVHYCVANIPGSVPLTSSEALNNATLPHVLALAEHGVAALDRDPHLANGLNVRGGEVTFDAVLEAMQAEAA